MTRLQELKNQIDSTTTAISKAEREFDLAMAARLKYETLPGLQKQLKAEEEIYEKGMCVSCVDLGLNCLLMSALGSSLL